MTNKEKNSIIKDLLILHLLIFFMLFFSFFYIYGYFIIKNIYNWGLFMDLSFMFSCAGLIYIYFKFEELIIY